MYVQETGRADRDGLPTYPLIMYGKGDIGKRRTSEQMRDYCLNCFARLPSSLTLTSVMLLSRREDVNVVTFVEESICVPHVKGVFIFLSPMLMLLH